ncbi:hypothetical protein D5F01_LYC13438 [Larimichthys crocea]|uniref:Uncharacterized protein n=1 Tax=Larimichthys crocea TaxID=215358 RepID=A0A6G0I785_LARCR|nr:hypothetical protein D5F01_LYC13438 [Larimichthys crocea]
MMPMTRTAKCCWLPLRTTFPVVYAKPTFPAGTTNANTFFMPIQKHKAADDLFCGLNDKRRQRWTETVESNNFTHSSRRGWQTLNKLTGRSTTAAQCPNTANSIASLLLSNGHFPNADKDFNRKTSARVQEVLRAFNFTTQEMDLVIQHLKTALKTAKDLAPRKAAEYCAPVWNRSTHVQKLDAALNTALQTVSGCLRATPTNQLPVLVRISPAEVRREAATLALARKAQLNESHLLHKVVTETPQQARLKSRHPFAILTQELFRTTPVDTSKAAWMKARWRDQWKAAVSSRLHQFIEDPTDVPGQDLPS